MVATVDSEGPGKPILSVAPMLAVTNTHFRNFMRCFTREAQLWTEMVTDGAILNNMDRLQQNLCLEDIEHPIVCQLGGSDPKTLAEAGKLIEKLGFDEINLNVGCPSNRVVSQGCFGAALMKTPETVRDIVHEIRRHVQIPVTVKTRIGYDHCDSRDVLRNFVQTVSAGGCRHFIVHARKAWLKGVDPKKNRSVPPLLYGRVYDLCDQFPHLDFSLNGGVRSIQQAIDLAAGKWTDGTAEMDALLRRITRDKTVKPLRGVMLGRAASADPCILANVDTDFYGADANPPTSHSRRTVLEAYRNYIKPFAEDGEYSHFALLKPVLGVFNGMPGNRLFRFTLDHLMRDQSRVWTAEEILAHTMAAVDETFPGVLEYPLRCPKPCRYDELSSKREANES
ncbi:dihydrouridine synthase, putative [Toxoplasma gondii ME49]|uniref:tRNA-dihydrouridine synthase n=1 Tax=Toxoplasma gondii (strain ATCC 50611 / Me49) TaxID=508771 RepID=S8EVZ1_TOXGM|nr:dihydrouridine synthase, putative [Toxoplasma gondii ME49]EPT27626.1 dihydrouridine synthase, putative [Toxoplasma gondii ME49]|eukprot:XP_002368767.1 dihydrouridine synthase, putative [Toxoplasma gondii ME49]